MTPAVRQYPVEADGLVTRVLECGAGSRAVVCLHGAGSRADRWRPALPLLAEAGYHAFAIDFPGHGLADKPAGYPYGTPAFTTAVLDVLDRLDLSAVSLLGTSIGGHVAAMVACTRPPQVTSAVLIGAVGLTPNARTDEPGRSPIIDSTPGGIRRKLEFLVEDQTLVTDEWVDEESRINSSPGAEEALAALGRYSADRLEEDLVGERYARLGIPTMLCWGAQDRWIPPRVGYDVAGLLPDAPFALVEGTGHAPYFERPDACVTAIVEFLDRPTVHRPGPFIVGPTPVGPGAG
jgi:2-hydroxy-6-oxonona-2,4-dienedioate hydrolase